MGKKFPWELVITQKYENGLYYMHYQAYNHTENLKLFKD